MPTLPVYISRRAGLGDPVAIAVGDIIGFPRNGVYMELRVVSFGHSGERVGVTARSKGSNARPDGSEYYFEGRQVEKLIFIERAPAPVTAAVATEASIRAQAGGRKALSQLAIGDVVAFDSNRRYNNARLTQITCGDRPGVTLRTKSGKEYLFAGAQLAHLVFIKTKVEEARGRAEARPPRTCPRAEFDNWYLTRGGHFETLEFAYTYHARGGDVSELVFAQACVEETGLLPFSARGDGGRAMPPQPEPAALPARPAPECDKGTFAAYFAAHGGASGDMDEAFDWHREGWDVLTPEYKQARLDAYEDDLPPSE